MLTIRFLSSDFQGAKTNGAATSSGLDSWMQLTGQRQAICTVVSAAMPGQVSENR
jgi:hypothetical protein